MQFANRSSFEFDPLPSDFNATSAANGVYTTPVEMRVKLGDLARLAYTRSDLRGTIRLSATDTAEFAVKLTDGVNTFASATVSISAGTKGYFKVEGIDLSNVKGDAQLRLVVDVTSAGTSANGQVAACLDVEHPVVLIG